MWVRFSDQVALVGSAEEVLPHYKLAEYRTRPPQVTEMAYALTQAGRPAPAEWPVTLEQALNAYPAPEAR